MVNDAQRRREDIREKLKKERAQELKKEKTRRAVMIGGISVASLAALGGLSWAIVASLPEQKPKGEQKIPTKADAHGAFHIDSTGAVIEDTEPSGSITRMDMFIDPQCPACGMIDRAIKDRVAELLTNEEIDLFLTPTAFLNNASTDKYSSRAVNALITVAEESPDHFMKFMHILFEEGKQPGEGGSYVPVSDEVLGERAVEAGVSQDVADKFAQRHYLDWIEQHTNTQLNDRPDLFPDGFATPSVFFNVDYDEEGKALSGYTKVSFQGDPVQDFNSSLEQAKSEE